MKVCLSQKGGATSRILKNLRHDIFQIVALDKGALSLTSLSLMAITVRSQRTAKRCLEKQTTKRGKRKHFGWGRRLLQGMHQMQHISVRQNSVIIFYYQLCLCIYCAEWTSFCTNQAFFKFLDRQARRSSNCHRKEIENDYKSKLKTIPDQKQKQSDPWGNLCSAEPSKK
jgi:hypothetical protein